MGAQYKQMSFRFKTAGTAHSTMRSMTTDTTCPFRSGPAAAPDRIQHPPGAWPPGPPSGLTGWGLLRRMSRDLLGALTDWRHRYGDVVHLRIWPEHQIVLTDPQLVRELLVNHHNDLIRWERGIAVFSQLHGKSVLTTEGETWRAKRHGLQPAFTPKQVQAFVPAIAAAAADAFGGWRGDGRDWPIESALNSLGMDVIVRTMFSSTVNGDAREAERAVHATAMAGNAEMYWPASWPDWMPWKRTKRRALRVLDGLIRRTIGSRLDQPRAQWPEDLLSRLLALHADDPAAWPLQAVRDECMTIFLAGHETTAATLTWWSWCMAAHPEVQARAQHEVDTLLQGRAPTAQDLPALVYLTQTLQETLRLYPAAPVLLTRRSVRPLVVGGWQFPARTMFTIPLQLLHHDPRWFPEPQCFHPDRFGAAAAAVPRGAFLPFGAGPRVCLGQHLALAEMTVIAAMFLQRFHVHTPAGMPPPAPVFNITLRPAQQLHLRLQARPLDFRGR